MPTRLVLVGFPDDENLVRRLASMPMFKADMAMVVTDSKDDVIRASRFVTKDAKDVGDDPGGNIVLVNSGADPQIIGGLERLCDSFGLKLVKSPVPDVAKSTGLGFGVVVPLSDDPALRQSGVSAIPQAAPVQEAPVQAPATTASVAPAPAAPVVTQPVPVAAPAPASSPVSSLIGDVYDRNGTFMHGGVSGPVTLEDGNPPYMEGLSEFDRRRQVAHEIANMSFGSLTFDPITDVSKTTILWVTGVSGGSGKTTLSYLLAQVLSTIMKNKGLEQSRPVYVIEADFDNSKWASRLNIPVGQDITHYIKETSRMHTLSLSENNRVKHIRAAIAGSTFTMPTGVRVIACPYDLRSGDMMPVQKAIGQVISYLTESDESDPIIIVDGSMPKPDDVVSIAMAHRAHAAILTSSRGNVPDIERALKTMMNELEIPRDRISLFHMKVNQAQYDALKLTFGSYSTAGFIPRIEEFEDQMGLDGAWVGHLGPGPVLDRVLLQVAEAINTISYMPEVEDFITYSRRKIASSPAASARRKFSLFKRK